MQQTGRPPSEGAMIGAGMAGEGGDAIQVKQLSVVNQRLSELDVFLSTLAGAILALEGALAEVLRSPDDEAEEQKPEIPTECVIAAKIGSCGRALDRHTRTINAIIEHLEV